MKSLKLFFPILLLLSACGSAPTIPTPTATLPPVPSATVAIVDQAQLQKELSKAIRDGKVEDVKHIIEAGVEVNAVLSYMQLTPLSLASYQGYVDIIALLLDNGADISAQNKNQYETTALIEAAQRGHLDAVKLLLERGADINQRDGFGDPALNWATYYGHKEVVQFLIASKAELTVIGSGGGTALNTAIAQGHTEIEQILRDAGATK